MTKQNRRQFMERLALGTAALESVSSGLKPTASEAQGSRAVADPLHAAVLSGNATAGRGQDGVLYCFDFGNNQGSVAPGFERISRVYCSPRFLWITKVDDSTTRLDNPDPLLRSFIRGHRGEFWMGLDDGDYRVTLIMADSEEVEGPFDIYVQDRLVKSGVVTKPGDVLKLMFPAKIVDEKLKVRFEAQGGSYFVLNELILEGPPHKAARRLFAQAPPDYLPTVEEVYREGNMATRETLRQYCDWLLNRRMPNGFIGDYESHGTSTSYWWYTTAYPVRTWLAGYDILRNPAYLDAAVNILDKLVAEQLPNGGWAQVYRNQPTKEMTQAEINDIVKHHWENLADIGSIVTALAIACRYVPASRRRVYLEAARRFCDDWAPKWQQASGGFTNGLENGVPQTVVYSSATGTEAAVFAAVYAVTRNPEYLERAQRAAEFLLDNWKSDGRPICHPDPSEKLGKPYVAPETQFGAEYYYHEGILFVYHQTRDRRFRAKVKRVYDWAINGEQGLLAALGERPWWPLQDTWDNSKMAGMPQVFLAYQGMASSPTMERVIGLARRFLCTSQFAQRIGIMVDEPDLPWGGHSLQSWAGCSVAATGFAGLSVAQMTKPGIIYLS